MSFSAIGFFVFLFVGLILYYVLPKNIQWVWLLILSYLYYFTFSVKASLFMVFATVTIYIGGILLETIQNKGNKYLADNKGTITKEEKKAYKEKIKKNKRLVLLLIILLDFGMLAAVKYTDFAIENLNFILSRLGIEPFNLVKIGMPLGISFFTFQSVSYAIDIYQGKYEAQKNIFKMGLFVSFFPQLLQGPIGRYDRLGKQLYEGHAFSLNSIEYGLQRIGWGLFKKLVIADRAAVLVLNVFNNYESYNGFSYIIAVLMYSVDLYMDFSGGIDIVIGAAQMFGITMDENFRQPYFSKSIGEFWRRWHITLGTWMKDYIFYPMSLSKNMNRFGKWAKKHLGNTVGRTLPICFANIVIFFVVGIWHGAAWKFIVYGLYNGFIIAISNLLEPVYKKLLNKFHINVTSKGWKIWQIIRTFILVNIGWYFDMANSMRQALSMMKWSVLGMRFSQLRISEILRLGIDTRDYVIIIAGCIIVFIVSVLKERGVAIRESIAAKPVVIRWFAYYALIAVILIFGYIGATQGFIYANF